MITLAFLRHAEAVYSSAAYLPDEQRVLTDTGRRQALTLRPIVARFAPDAVWCSDLQRATETWSLAKGGTGFRAVEHGGLAERRLRSLEGLSIPEIIRRIGPDQAARARVCTDLVDVPGEESILQAAARLVATVGHIVRTCVATNAKRVLVVSHGGPSSWLLCRLIGVPLERNRLFQHDSARFHVLRLTNGPSDGQPEGLRLSQVVALNCQGPNLND